MRSWKYDSSDVGKRAERFFAEPGIALGEDRELIVQRQEEEEAERQRRVQLYADYVHKSGGKLDYARALAGLEPPEIKDDSPCPDASVRKFVCVRCGEKKLREARGRCGQCYNHDFPLRKCACCSATTRAGKDWVIQGDVALCPTHKEPVTLAG